MPHFKSFPLFLRLETAVSYLGNARFHQWKRNTNLLEWKFMDV